MDNTSLAHKLASDQALAMARGVLLRLESMSTAQASRELIKILLDVSRSAAKRVRDKAESAVTTTYFATQRHPHDPKSKKYQVVTQQGDHDQILAEFDSEWGSAMDAEARRKAAIHVIPLEAEECDL